MICNFIVDGVDRYSIRIVRSGGHFDLYADRCPASPRGGSVHEHHLYSSGEICVAEGYEPRTIDRAKAIAMSWCEGWSKYIRGYSFPNEAKRVNVNS